MCRSNESASYFGAQGTFPSDVELSASYYERALGFHRKYSARLIVLAFFLFVVPSLKLARPGAAGPVKTHDREFWRTIVKNRFAVPEGQPVFPLVRELSGLLGSPDPELRDDLAYSIIGTWIAHRKQLSGDELNSLADEWRANLKNAVGESGTDTVFKRSFSALCLSAIAERDLQTPFLSAGQFQSLLDDALTYLKQSAIYADLIPSKGGFTPPRIRRTSSRSWPPILR